MPRTVNARESEFAAPCEFETHLTEDNEGDSAKQDHIPQWDVSHAAVKTGKLRRLTMLPSQITHVVANIGIAAPALAGGYCVSKVGDKLGVKKTMDSRSFQSGAMALLWSNGVFPTVEYEPLAAGGKPEKDMTLTPLLVSNHTSYLDGIIMAIVFKFPRIVAKAGSRKVPIFGKLMEEMDVVFVDRANSNSRQATLDAISGHCDSWTLGQRPLLIFPEGTTSNGEGMLDFKKGSFVAGVPVRPVIVVYTGQWDPASCNYRDTGNGVVEEDSVGEWAKQLTGHFVHSVHVRVLAPYIPNDAEKADPEVYAQNCQQHMAAAHERIRAEVQERSWKAAAGRETGGLGYLKGDIVRSAIQKASSCRKSD